MTYQWPTVKSNSSESFDCDVEAFKFCCVDQFEQTWQSQPTSIIATKKKEVFLSRPSAARAQPRPRSLTGLTTNHSPLTSPFLSPITSQRHASITELPPSIKVCDFACESACSPISLPQKELCTRNHDLSHRHYRLKGSISGELSSYRTLSHI